MIAALPAPRDKAASLFTGCGVSFKKLPLFDAKQLSMLLTLQSTFILLKVEDKNEGEKQAGEILCKLVCSLDGAL